MNQETDSEEKLEEGIKEEIRPDDAADALAIAICGVSNKIT